MYVMHLLKHLSNWKKGEDCASFYDVEALRKEAADRNKANNKRNMKENFDKTPEKQRREERSMKYQKNCEAEKQARMEEAFWAN